MSAPSSQASAAWISDSPELGFDTPSSVSRTLGAETCSPITGRESRSTRTYALSAQVANTLKSQRGRGWSYDPEATYITELGGVQPELRPMGAATPSGQSISSAEASPARTCPSPADAPDLPEPAAASSTSSPESLSLFDLDGFSSRTYPDCSPRTAVGTSESCLERWPTSGTAWAGGLSTAVSSECRSDEGGCSSSEPSLSEILEPPQNVPERYSLSARAAQGILRRAEKRGRTLPEHLAAALEAVAGHRTPNA